MNDDPIFDFIFKHFSKTWLATAIFIIVFWCFIGALIVKGAHVAWNTLDNATVEMENK